MKLTRIIFTMIIFLILNSAFSRNISSKRHRFHRYHQTVRRPIEKNYLIVVDIRGISADNDRVYCPPDYQFAGNETSDQKVAINQINHADRGAGGKYIYLCVKYKSFKQLTGKDTIVNFINLQINNQDCGKFKRVEQNLNEGTNGRPVYLCFGEVKSSTLAPLNFLFIHNDSSSHLNGVNVNSISGYRKAECSYTNLNFASTWYNNEQYNFQHICFTREDKAVKRIVFTDFNLDYANKVITQARKPQSITDIMIQNGVSIKNSVKKNLQEAKTKDHTTINEGSVKISGESETTGGIPLFSVFTLTINVSVSFSFTATFASTNSLKESKSTDVICNALEHEDVKCSFFVETSVLKIPYSYNKIIYFYDGTKETYPYQGKIDNLFSSDIQMNKCCNTCSEKMKNTPKCVEDKQIREKPVEENTGGVLTIDKFIITDIKIMFSSERLQSCPSGYDLVSCGTTTEGLKEPCELKSKRSTSASNWVIICIEKTNLKDFTPDKTIINEFRLNLNNMDCGSLKLVGDATAGNLNQDDEGDKIWLCIGNDENSTNAPITDIVFKYADKYGRNGQYKPSIIDSNPTCNDLDLNSGVNDKDISIYLCAVRDTSLPKKIEINEIIYKEVFRNNISVPKELTAIEVAGGSITKTIQTVNKTVTRDTFVYQVGAAIAVSISTGNELWTGVKQKFKVAVEGNYKRTEENITTDETTDSVTFTCEAPDDKKIRCIFFQTQEEFSVDYEAQYFYILYDGKKEVPVKYKGTIQGTTASSISVKTCCLSNCAATDTKCDSSSQTGNTTRNTTNSNMF